MKRSAVVGIISIVVLLFAAIGSSGGQTQPSTVDFAQPAQSKSNQAPKESIKKAAPVCDGTVVTSSCEVEGVSYTTYIYHEAVAEKSHNETVTTYEQEVASYCTLCNDGTYSPSCATGRGACSHHGGVAQWNAPRYRSVPKYTTHTIIDTPAREAYYEKVIAQ